jgi:hypothetical protein
MTNMKDSVSLPTDFGVDLNFALSHITVMPAIRGSHNGYETDFSEAPAIVVRCPDEMISQSRVQGGAFQQMGVLNVGDSWFGLVYLYDGNHLATALFDLGAPEGQAVLRFALANDQFRLLMVGETDQVLSVHVLTEAMRNGLLKASSAREAGLSNFSGAVTTVKEGYAKSATWRGFGIDPMLLKSLTMSLCLSSDIPSGGGWRDIARHEESVH